MPVLKWVNPMRFVFLNLFLFFWSELVNKVIISVGSNIEPEKHVSEAKQILTQDKLLLDESRFNKTLPRGYINQPAFLNGAFFIHTSLEIQELKKYLKTVENQLGRIRTFNKNGPRTIDLDIVLFNNDVVDLDYYKYDFVKVAVDEILSRQNR